MRKIPRVAYTLEYKLEAVRRVRSGEAMRRATREIGAAEQTLRNWSKAQADGKLGGGEKGRPITPDQTVENQSSKWSEKPKRITGSRCQAANGPIFQEQVKPG